MSAAAGDAIGVCFFFNAQRHQLLHGISTAVELARRPGFAVTVASPSADHIAYARQLADRLGGAPIAFVVPDTRLLAATRRRTGRTVPPKLLTLATLARWLNRFDAIALPERTSTILRSLGMRRPRLIHLDHGAGDRAAGFDRRIRRFDFVLMAGEKHRQRLMRAGLIRAGAHAVTGYPKFDAADAARDVHWTPFPGDPRPIVLYNPHFSPLGSWERDGPAVLAAFAAQDRYNLIVAPHVRLLDGAKAGTKWAALLDRYDASPRIHIDRGSDRAIDMTHTSLADIYLGDVSSQVYEFLRTPRPCLFLDAHGIAWEADENYAHWHYGPVLRTTDGLIAAVDAAVAGHDRWRNAQVRGFAATFSPAPETGSWRAARAIAGYLDGLRRFSPGRGRLASLARAAALLLALGLGWLAHDAAGPLVPAAGAGGFVDEALDSHRATIARAAMRSQRESADYDRAEIARATGIAMPAIPAGWRIGDVQIFPSDAGPSVQLLLRDGHGTAVSFIAMRMDIPAGARPMVESRAGEHIVYWDRGSAAFGLVGEVDSQRLLSLAAALDR